MKLALEQRYLFDGAVAATVPHALGDAQNHHHPDGVENWDTGDNHDNPGAALPTPPAIGEPSVGRSGSPATVLFVDPRVADWQELVAGVKPGVDVVMLDAHQDGISQVTRALAGLTNVWRDMSSTPAIPPTHKTLYCRSDFIGLAPVDGYVAQTSSISLK